MKKPLSVILTALAGIALIVIGLVFVAQRNKNTASQLASNGIAHAQALPIVYTNATYSFSFTLPAGWSGYSIINDEWMGNPSDTNGTKPAEKGPLVTIRHPRWTASAPRQDIPIMVFTVKQWSNLLAEKFSIGAAPVPPTELGRNDQYVFALPARYNYAFPIGYEQVNSIIAGKPLHAF